MLYRKMLWNHTPILHCPYNYEDTKLIVKEMSELLTLDLVKKNLVTNQIVMTIGYDVEKMIKHLNKLIYLQTTIKRSRTSKKKKNKEIYKKQ